MIKEALVGIIKLSAPKNNLSALNLRNSGLYMSTSTTFSGKIFAFLATPKVLPAAVTANAVP